MFQRMSDIEASRRRLRIFLAKRAIALGWALKGPCKPCAHRLFSTARWLVPEAQRFLLRRTGAHHRHWRISQFAADWGSRLSRIQLGVVGCLIVLTFLGLLDLTKQATQSTQVVVENSSSVHDPQHALEQMQGLVSETGSLPRVQIAPVPLPMRKPEVVYKAPNGKAAKSHRAVKKMAQQKKRSRPMR